MRKPVDLASCRLLSTHQIKLRWVDMDAYHHVNNARYFDYMAEARADYFAKILEDRNTQYVLVHVSCDFKKPLVYPKTILIKQYLVAMTRSTFTFHYTFHEMDDDAVVYANGEGVLVAIDAKTAKPVSIPEHVKNKINSD